MRSIDARDRAMLQARLDGATLDEIAEAFGLTHQGVGQAIRRLLRRDPRATEGLTPAMLPDAPHPQHYQEIAVLERIAAQLEGAVLLGHAVREERERDEWPTRSPPSAE